MLKSATSVLFTTNTFLLLMIMVVGFNYVHSYKKYKQVPNTHTAGWKCQRDGCNFPVEAPYTQEMQPEVQKYCNCVCNSNGEIHQNETLRLNARSMIEDGNAIVTLPTQSGPQKINCSTCSGETVPNVQSCNALEIMQKPPAAEPEPTEEEVKLKQIEFVKNEVRLVADSNCVYKPQCTCDSDCPRSQRCSKLNHICVQACDNCR